MVGMPERRALWVNAAVRAVGGKFISIPAQHGLTCSSLMRRVKAECLWRWWVALFKSRKDGAWCCEHDSGPVRVGQDPGHNPKSYFSPSICRVPNSDLYAGTNPILRPCAAKSFGGTDVPVDHFPAGRAGIIPVFSEHDFLTITDQQALR